MAIDPDVQLLLDDLVDRIEVLEQAAHIHDDTTPVPPPEPEPEPTPEEPEPDENIPFGTAPFGVGVI